MAKARKAPNGFGSIRSKTINGKTYWEGRYSDPILNKQKSVCATTQAECMRKLREVQAAIARGDYTTPQKTTLGQWLNSWLNTREGIEETTRSLYERSIRLYIVPNIGNIQIQKLQYIHCQEFVNKLARDPEREKPLHPKTIKNTVGVLHKALDTAVQARLIPSNPASNLDIPRVEKPAPKVMQRDEQERFLEVIAASPYHDIFFIGLYTGMRISEVLGLQWKNVNLQTGEVRIDHQLDRKRGNDTARKLKSTKTHNARSTVLPQFVLDELRATNIRQKTQRLKAGPAWMNADDLVFTREDGSPMPHNTVSKAFKKAATQIGRSDLSFHSLRHTFITDALAEGIDVKTVAELVGHADARMTLNVYAAATDEMKKAAAERMQKRHEAKNA